MAVLSSNFLVLFTIIHDIMYINQPYNAKNIFICFDKNGVKNDSWPSEWTEMSPTIMNNGHLFTSMADVPENASVYKLRIIFQDQRVGDSRKWQNLHNCEKSISPDFYFEISSIILMNLLFTIAIIGTFFYLYYGKKHTHSVLELK